MNTSATFAPQKSRCRRIGVCVDHPDRDVRAYIANTRPDFILIMTNGQGNGDLGCHGYPEIRTPNLEQLHTETIRLTYFHVSPSCSPTRAARMTGQHPRQTEHVYLTDVELTNIN